MEDVLPAGYSNPLPHLERAITDELYLVPLREHSSIAIRSFSCSAYPWPKMLLLLLYSAEGETLEEMQQSPPALVKSNGYNQSVHVFQ